MKSLLLVAVLAIFAGKSLTLSTESVIAGRCANLDFTIEFDQYLADDDNPHYFWHCKKIISGVYEANLQECPPCLNWNNKIWACSIPVPGCSTEPAVSESVQQQDDWCIKIGYGATGLYVQKFQNDGYIGYKWDANGTIVSVPCPPGTRFNRSSCKCDSCKGLTPCAVGSDLKYVFDFDGIGSERGIYYNLGSTKTVSFPSPVRSLPKSAHLKGGSTIEVPYFENNEFSQFVLNMSFWRDPAGGNGIQGLFYNGNKVPSPFWPGSIAVTSVSPTHFQAGIRTNFGVTYVNYHEAEAGAWTTFCLKYDGQLLQLFVGDILIEARPIQGTVQPVPIAAAYGVNYYSGGGIYYFNGYLDDLSFCNSIVC